MSLVSQEINDISDVTNSKLDQDMKTTKYFKSFFL
jgi:hypothetical protein